MLATDATTLFFRNQLMYDAARDASRQVALGRRTNDIARDEMLGRFDAELPYSGSVVTSDGYVTASVKIPIRNVTTVGGYFSGETELRADVTMWIESTVSP